MDKRLIELYFDDSYEHFCKGFYYDEGEVRYPLKGEFLMGAFTDAYSIQIEDSIQSKHILCRYHMGPDYVEFYEVASVW